MGHTSYTTMSYYKESYAINQSRAVIKTLNMVGVESCLTVNGVG